MWHSWQGDGAPDLRVDYGKAVEVKEGGKKRKLSGCDGEEQHLLIRSDKGKTGYKGVHPHRGRHQATCDTSPCRNNHLDTFGTPEEGAQADLQHHPKQHPEELKKERAPPLQVQEHLLIRSDKNSTGYKGVYPHKGRFQAACDTSPCPHNHLGMFKTPEQAAQAYLQHQQHSHNHQAALPPCPKDEGRHGWLRMFNALHEQQQRQQPRVGDRISVNWPCPLARGRAVVHPQNTLPISPAATFSREGPLPSNPGAAVPPLRGP